MSSILSKTMAMLDWDSFQDIVDIVVAVEREAFLMGRYLALGLKGGSCFLCR